MRQQFFYLLTALLIFGAVTSSCVSAQENTNAKLNDKFTSGNLIEESKFKEILSKTEENLKDKTYRLTKTEEYFSDRNASSERVTIKILELIPPNKRREVEEVKSPEKNTRLERIWDGKNLYEKQDNGEWQKYSGGGSTGGDIISGQTKITYKFVGKESLNNKIADVYESESRRVANKMTQTSLYRVEYITKTKYWIGENIMLLKTVRESEVAGSNALSREVAVYEYDSNIKIETPVK